MVGSIQVKRHPSAEGRTTRSEREGHVIDAQLDIEALEPFGAIVRGVVTADPQLAAERLLPLLGQFTLLVLRGHEPPTDDQLSLLAKAFGAFGELEANPLVPTTRHGHPEISIISHMVESGKPVGAGRTAEGGLFWHTDYSWQERVGRVGLLDAVEVPRVGGETCFADMRAAFAALPVVEQQRLRSSRCVHTNDIGNYYGTAPGSRPKRAIHPAVVVDPTSGRPALYMSPGFTTEIEGVDVDEPDAYLRGLLSFATRPENVYEHRWQEGDLVIWNQIATIHCRKPYDPGARRYMRKISLTLFPWEQLEPALA
jgi:taurine dioxygenase/pentalenolactone F synthase